MNEMNQTNLAFQLNYRQQQGRMKYTVYILTYLAYAMNHACRMTYAYNKQNFKSVFGLSPVHLGLIDALIYFSYGIGSCFRYYFFGGRHLTRLYLISALCISTFFSCLPCLSLFFPEQIYYHIKNDRSVREIDIAIAVGMVGYGFSHSATWQTVLALMTKHWHSKKEGSHIGFWSSMSCIGNMVGFSVSNAMIIELKCRWEVTMLFFAILNLLMALLMYFFIDQPTSSQQSITLPKICYPNSDSIQQSDNQPIEEENITMQECMTYIKKKFQTWDFRLFMVTSTCVKVLNYSFLFWYPTYLFVEGFESTSGYIAMLFEFASIFGSFLVGKLMMYDRATCARFGVDQTRENKCLDALTICLKLRNVIMLFFSVGMSFLFLENFGSLVANILITILLGCTIGGIFHVNATFNPMTIGEHIPRNVDMVSTFTTGLGNCVMGLFQLVIGLVVNVKVPPNSTFKQTKHMKAWSYRNFFKFMIAMMFITATVMLLRSGVLWMLCPKEKKETEQTSSTKEEQNSNRYLPVMITEV